MVSRRVFRADIVARIEIIPRRKDRDSDARSDGLAEGGEAGDEHAPGVAQEPWGGANGAHDADGLS